MHRVIWPYIGEVVGLNIGTQAGRQFVPVMLAAADERVFTVEYNSARLHFGMQWVVTTAEGRFRVGGDQGDQTVRLLVEVHRPDADAHASSFLQSTSQPGSKGTG